MLGAVGEVMSRYDKGNNKTDKAQEVDLQEEKLWLG